MVFSRLKVLYAFLYSGGLSHAPRRAFSCPYWPYGCFRGREASFRRFGYPSRAGNASLDCLRGSGGRSPSLSSPLPSGFILTLARGIRQTNIWRVLKRTMHEFADRASNQGFVLRMGYPQNAFDNTSDHGILIREKWLGPTMPRYGTFLVVLYRMTCLRKL